MQLVGDIIKPRDIYGVNADDTVRQAVHYLCERKTGAVAVRSGDEVVGIFSERDLMHRVVNAGLNPDTTKVSEVMTPDVLSIHADEDIRMAKAIMFKNKVRHLLVVGRGDQLKGLISMRDIMDADMADSAELIQKLNDEYYEKAYRSKWRVSSNRVIVEPYISQ
ncbi:MAG: CBS domain-containing protein [Candidatus Hydrogenedentes bacterium]|nr:CBS domain-containing protein [Candidatus Hydrogenedentota bacterium]